MLAGSGVYLLDTKPTTLFLFSLFCSSFRRPVTESGGASTKQKKALQGPSPLQIMSAGNTGTRRTERDEAYQLAEAAVDRTKEYEADELERLGLGVKHREERIRDLRSEKISLDGSILDLEVSIGKYQASCSIPVNREVDAQSEDETYKNILELEKSAAGLVHQLRTQQGTQVSHSPLVKDVLGFVATLGKTDDENLSWLLAEYLGRETMIAIVCRNSDGVQALKTFGIEGAIDRNHVQQGHGSSAGRTIDGRFQVICLADIRPYDGEFIYNDPQRRLDILKPKLPGGILPRGFLGYAVNMIDIDNANVWMATPHYGLRETLFYHLFSHLQVYETKEDMLKARPFISDGAVSLDGGIMRRSDNFYMANREKAIVKFPMILGKPSLPGDYYETKNDLQIKKWKLEILLENICREQSVLDQDRFNFEVKRQEFVQLARQQKQEH
ncbi:protein DEFECTIVE IN MERISTEM SILENCING 3-like [Daucus carota subsp. sativus]|uniref:protein DEFECTIVE IN MERISTEM SILENCING 3-like n=1 Tax=Daucus carota subsp. sativus TaxID=79200 RepID=UPI003083EDF5